MPRWVSGRTDADAATRLRTSRDARAKTRLEAARACHVSVETIENWETARSEPRLSDLKTLCSLYDVTPDYILLGA